MRRAILVVLFMWASVVICFGELVVIPMPDMIGEVPPSITAPISFPDDLADVDSVGIRYCGVLTEGLAIRWNQTEPEPIPAWPEFMLEIDGNEGWWGGHIPYSVPPGEVDVMITLNPYGGDDFDFRGCNGSVRCSINAWGLWDVLVYPTGQSTQVDFLLWTSSGTPVKTSSWSFVKALF